ncbi:hypothetical protein MKW94_001471 [Papaver nudicaule]|uniref:histone acetyltransferase n=1 Tax=Papaver nudicaule TaxID=74823 RepID=A0AA42B407_PAPNU|nr:hypothetical protein [Papaver nudicaule]
MHAQTHMSGQISGQVTNQVGPQISGMPQHNGSLAPMQNFAGFINNMEMDPEVDRSRTKIREKILSLMTQRPATTEMLPKLRDMVKRLDDGLYRNASSQEEYMNVATLEQRLRVVVRQTQGQNQNQQLPHSSSSSSSVGTMIPTPGMSHHSGNVNSSMTSSMVNPMISSTGSLQQNTVNMGQLLPAAAGSSGGVHGGSFNSSNGGLPNGYEQSPSGISFGSGGANMMPQRIPSQMIPTPGLSNAQSSVNSESINNGGGFPGVNSSTLPQSKPYIGGGNNSRILQHLGGQVGRSNLQQKASSYGFSNGAMNGGLGTIGNNMQLMNGPASSDAYLTASAYSNSSKPLHQHFDQQRQQLMPSAVSQQMVPMAGDGYGLTSDLSGSGNVYGGYNTGSSMDNQNLNSASVQPKSKTNPTLMVNQPNLQAMKQVKPEMIDHSSKVSFQPAHSSHQQTSKFQSQQFQQNNNQLQQQQFVQHQNMQKQQNQHHQQLLLKNDALRQAQLSHLGENLVEHGTETHNEVLQSQDLDQFQLSDLQSHFQQNSGAQNYQLSIPPQNSQHMQQTMQPNDQTAEAQNNFGFSAGPQSEALLQGQWNIQSQEKLQKLDQPSHEQHIQEEFRQRMTEQDEAQRPHHFSDGSLTGQIAASRAIMVPTTSSAAGGASDNALKEKTYRDQQKWLLLLTHARSCIATEGKCPLRNCLDVQNFVKHISNCSVQQQCPDKRCSVSKGLIEHLRMCRDSACALCVPARDAAAKCKAGGRALFVPNVVSGSWKPVHATKTSSSTIEATQDLQSSLKRMKVEHPSSSHVPKVEGSPVLVPAMSQPHVSHVEHSQTSQHVEIPVASISKINDVKTERVFGRGNPNMKEVRKDESDDVHIMRIESESVIPNETAPLAKQEIVKVEKEIEQESTAISTENAPGKSGKSKVKGVSLTELFTPEQIREHIKGLRQWVGQSKAKAEKNQAMETQMNENSCQLCAVEKLTFEPPPIYCTPCGARIKRNATFYTMGSGDTRHFFCIPCYNEARGDSVEVDGNPIPKNRLEKKKNDEETEEWWVQCDKCEAWQHQICALFNGRRNDGGQAEYTCPNCYIGEVERGERKPLPQSAVLGAKDLPKTTLSDHIESRLFKRLRQEKLERARYHGKSIDEVPGAESLVVRVVSSVDKKLEVKPRFLDIFKEDNYPPEFPYKSKVVLLFQKIEGVEVCLFGMYVQEFGSECQYPNQRRVYLSYLDSVKYFRPEIRTVSGEALRTFVYHEILIGYLEYCKLRGFTSCYIWACPPLKGEDYILYCHPEIQKTPKSDKLREWYLAMLRKASKENIVAELTNLYDHFFISTGECKAKVTASRLPYFDGDYWPGAAEDMINQLIQEEDGRKLQKKGKTKKLITKRALKAAGHTDLSLNASKDVLLMQKLGETICPMKEDFIMVHLQHSCNHCCNLMVSGNRWVCNSCKRFQLCDKCYDAEQKLEEREKHPINGRDKHSFHPVEVKDVTQDTKDKDEILESEFFDTRQAFLSLCQGNHYQYDTLRRAKHSSMMVLYHLHNPTAPAFVTTCNKCQQDIEAGQGWRCEICPDYDVCNLCFQKDGGVDHPHKLTNHPSTAEQNAQNTEARQKRVLQLRKMLDLLVHASQCRYPQCQYPNCRKVKGLFRHGIQCKKRASGGCVLCKKMWYLLQLHARACKESECHVPRCRDLKDHLRRLQQQSDSRRRAAVMEMMRQRAAEVAGNNG